MYGCGVNMVSMSKIIPVWKEAKDQQQQFTGKDSEQRYRFRFLSFLIKSFTASAVNSEYKRIS